MAIKLLIAAVVGGALSYVVWNLPAWIRASTERARLFETAVDCFYEEAEKLLHDERTPQSVVEFLNHVSSDIDDPTIVRRVVWSAMIGRLRRDAANPPEPMRAFLRELNGMPANLRTDFARAMGAAFLANAMTAGLMGEIFLRFMLPNPKGQPEMATALAAEVAGSCPAVAA